MLDDLFESKELTSLLSRIAGQRLAPHPMGVERAHINVQKKPTRTWEDEEAGGEDEEPVFGWHKDTQP